MPEVLEIDLHKDGRHMYREVAIFTDSILMISNDKTMFVKVDYLRDLPNLKYFKNLIQVISQTKYINLEIKTEQQK